MNCREDYKEIDENDIILIEGGYAPLDGGVVLFREGLHVYPQYSVCELILLYM